jgi:Predicted signal transduction protein with a C-terminal ATPase domain
MLMSMAMLTYYSFYRTLKEEKEKSVQMLIDQISDKFNYNFNDLEAMMLYISQNKSINVAFKEYGEMSIQEKFYLNERITSYTNNVNILNDYINDIILIGKNGYTKNLKNYGTLLYNNNLPNMPWIKHYSPGENSNFFFVPPHISDYYSNVSSKKLVVSVILPIATDRKRVGFIQGDLDYGKLKQLLDKVYEQNEISVSMVTNEGTMVFNQSEKMINKRLDKKLLLHMKDDSGTFIEKISGERNLFIYKKSDISGWYLLAQIPYTVILEAGQTIFYKIIFIIMPISILVTLTISYFLVRQIKKPLGELCLRVEQVDVENFIFQEVNYGTLEIDILGAKFEKLMEDINELVQRVYVEELLRKNAQLVNLRNQISPHFLYNSLQLIKTEAVMVKNREISKIVTNMANLLRYSMNINTTHVTVKEELDYIEDYLEIYCRRYDGKLKYEINVQDEIKDFKMQKMILQPIVENCIKHNFDNIKSGITITIIGYKENESFIFEIIDNGIGIEQKKIEEIFNDLLNSYKTTDDIGLGNVHNRIFLECGSGYGITGIESQKGVYTKFILKMRCINCV